MLASPINKKRICCGAQPEKFLNSTAGSQPWTLAAIIMCHLILIAFFTVHNYTCDSQTFLHAYEKYRLDRADTLSNPKTKKRIKSFIKSQIIELDTIFQSYKSKTNFDFNNADTLFLIYDSPAESPFIGNVIIWSGKDTITYKQGFETIKPFKYKRIITYEPFTAIDRPKGFKVVTERDSLITLVSKRILIP